MALLFFAFLLFATMAMDVVVATVVVVLDHEPQRKRERERERGKEIFFLNFLGCVVSNLFLALCLVVLRRVGPTEERFDLVIMYRSHKNVEIFE